MFSSVVRRSVTRVASVQRLSVARFSGAAIARQASPASHKDTSSDPVIPGYREEGEIAKNWELATGNERYEFLKKLEGKEPWEGMQPIVLTSKPTTKNPVVLRGDDPEQYIGCTGFPAESHETVWLTVRPHKGFDRCPHCGNVFKYIQNEAHHHH
ncbi:Cytochrome c oxidase subunit 4 [Blyttiomyces sp. JEL0837]|nr:Cytochrome c oxidase subunit 4 [Blyttiomyces sp. JEL0837]